ncbi:MAG: hypothetical protein ACP5NP_13305 [Acetobacteraceae bacterium]
MVPAEITVTPLTAAEIDLVYPLVRSLRPAPDKVAWRRHARQSLAAAAGGRGGIMVARRAGREHPSGLCCWRKEWDFQRGPVLTASHFVALDILDPAPVLAALAGGMTALAARLGCVEARALVAGEATGALAGAGLHPAGALLGMDLRTPTDPVSARASHAGSAPPPAG